MTQDEIIELAKQAGLLVIGTSNGGDAVYTWPKGITDEIEAFAKLVAEKEREACAKLIAKLTEMLEIQQKLHETAIDMLKPAIEAEREACAKVADSHMDGTPEWNSAANNIAASIRARGQA